MNEQFFRLPEEKQLRIINAGLEVFSRYDYKKASTEDIASKAGISKGLLFHYFHNKKAFYLFLMDYSQSLTRGRIVDEEFYRIDDFFELLSYASKIKVEVVIKNPYLLDFTMRAFYSEREEVSGDLQRMMKESLDSLFDTYFKNIRRDKFKEGVDPVKVCRMLVWMTEGYLTDKRRLGGEIVLEELMREFEEWSNMFRSMVYKEEFLYDGD